MVVTVEIPDVAPDLVINRWKRWGKDRLYVSRPDETKLGWWDLQSGAAVAEEPHFLDELTEAALAWCEANSVAPYTVEAEATPSSSAEPEPDVEEDDDIVDPDPVVHPDVLDELAADDEPDDEPAEQPVAAEMAAAEVAAPEPWLDLATNAAGESARQVATAHREAAPVRTALARLLGVRTEERAWRIGADGEQKVGARLEKMAAKDPRWKVLHAIPVGNRGSDIDHLVIGPGGVFTLNAKHHPKAKIWVGGNTFMVNGSKQQYVRNSRHEAKRAGELLSTALGTEAVTAHGVIVVVNAGEFTVKSQPVGVSVVPRAQVARWLTRHGEVLSDVQVEALYEVARRSTTWRS